MWELPSGKREPLETTKEALKREFLEEVGLLNFIISYPKTQWTTLWSGYGWITIYLPSAVPFLLAVTISAVDWAPFFRCKRYFRVCSAFGTLYLMHSSVLKTSISHSHASFTPLLISYTKFTRNSNFYVPIQSKNKGYINVLVD